MIGIMSIVISLEESGLLIKDVVKQLKIKKKNIKLDFLACY